MKKEFNPKIGYSSHGEYCSWAEMKNIEVDERNNYTKSQVKRWERKYKLSDADDVIWITPSRKIAVAYGECASEYDAIMDLADSKLDEYMMERGIEEPVEINLKDGLLIPESDDGDDGYLFVWRPEDGRSREPEIALLKQMLGMA